MLHGEGRGRSNSGRLTQLCQQLLLGTQSHAVRTAATIGNLLLRMCIYAVYAEAGSHRTTAAQYCSRDSSSSRLGKLSIMPGVLCLWNSAMLSMTLSWPCCAARVRAVDPPLSL